MKDIINNLKEIIDDQTGVSEEARDYAAKLLSALNGGGGEDGDTERSLALYLNGSLPQDRTFALKNKFINADFSFSLITFLTERGQKELSALVRELCAPGDYLFCPDKNSTVLLKKSTDFTDYRSVNEFAETVAENIREEMNIDFKIGIGGETRDFNDLAEVYGQSLAAVKIGKTVSMPRAVYSYKQYLLIKLIGDLPPQMLKRYLDLLLDKNAYEILDDTEIMNTADVFMSNSLNISETSRVMYIHRNTLIYRLDKIEKSTGLDIRNFNDAVTFRLMEIVYKIVKSAGI